MSKSIKVEWAELPPPISGRSASSAVLDAIEQLKERPGCWAIVERDVSATHMADKFKRRGCEVASRRNPGTNPPTVHIYARWPKSAPDEPAPLLSTLTAEAKARARARRTAQAETDPALTEAAATPDDAPKTVEQSGPPTIKERPARVETPPITEPPSAPSPEDIESALRTQGEAVGIQFPAGFDFTDPTAAKAARERISFARGRARRGATR
jgi:hypothetical protein